MATRKRAGGHDDRLLALRVDEPRKIGDAGRNDASRAPSSSSRSSLSVRTGRDRTAQRSTRFGVRPSRPIHERISAKRLRARRSGLGSVSFSSSGHSAVAVSRRDPVEQRARRGSHATATCCAATAMTCGVPRGTTTRARSPICSLDGGRSARVVRLVRTARPTA